MLGMMLYFGWMLIIIFWIMLNVTMYVLMWLWVLHVVFWIKVDVIFWMKVECDYICGIVIMNCEYCILDDIIFWMNVKCDFICSYVIMSVIFNLILCLEKCYTICYSYKNVFRHKIKFFLNLINNFKF